MSVVLNPRGRGGEWMQGKGPASGKTCSDAIEFFGWDLDSKEALEFDAGAEAAADLAIDDAIARGRA